MNRTKGKNRDNCVESEEELICHVFLCDKKLFYCGFSYLSFLVIEFFVLLDRSCKQMGSEKRDINSIDLEPSKKLNT